MNKNQRLLLAVLSALAFAFIVRGIFGIDGLDKLYSVMTVAFLLGLPFAVGYIAVYLCKIQTIQSWAAAFFIPFIPVLAFLLLTLLTGIEGLACWIMISPIFFLLAALGGITCRYFRLKKDARKNKSFVMVVMLLPFFISPIEKLIGAIPGRYQAYTEIDIHASKETIWQNVARVKPIPVSQDSAFFTRLLGFPRPIKAELDTAAMGGRREAIFDNGLIFHEEVINYQPLKLMVFTIKANPYEIPAATMDKHIVVGGDFFDVLNGTYKLEQIDAHTCKLRLYSNFKLSTTFNFYASVWAGWIMKDIQQNILKVIKERSEKI